MARNIVVKPDKLLKELFRIEIISKRRSQSINRHYLKIE